MSITIAKVQDKPNRSKATLQPVNKEEQDYGSLPGPAFDSVYVCLLFYHAKIASNENFLFSSL